MKTWYIIVGVMGMWMLSVAAIGQDLEKEARQETGKGAGEKLGRPLDIPVALSGNFGELRTNHFHSGIDFKTQQVEGKPVYAVADGYVSRIAVNSGGYGKALYITHPIGLTTVYGHLQRFAPAMEAFMKEQQYAAERFKVDMSLSARQFPVKKGDLIAWSGNTGSSQAPHLHFEVRDAKTEEVLDPLAYYRTSVADGSAPQASSVMLYPVAGKGVVNGSGRKQAFGQGGRIEAWGKVGVAVKAFDYMDEAANIYGVKEITLTVDSKVIFHSLIDRFAFSETRYLNSFIDYAEWTLRHSFYMKSFIEPGNRLRFMKARNRGYITLDEERNYHLQYTLTDAHGNTSRYAFTLTGKQQPVPPAPEADEAFRWNTTNRFSIKGLRLILPEGCLYDDLHFRYAVSEDDSTALAPIHTLHDEPVAFHSSASLSLRLQQAITAEVRQYGIIRINNGQRLWVGGTYRDGWLTSGIRETGAYTIACDTLPPDIRPVQPDSWRNRHRFVFSLSDNLSGVAAFRGEVDGAYVLFESDNQSTVTYDWDAERLPRGEHTLRFTATDACGNETVYTCPFQW